MTSQKIEFGNSTSQLIEDYSVALDIRPYCSTSINIDGLKANGTIKNLDMVPVFC